MDWSQPLAVTDYCSAVVLSSSQRTLEKRLRDHLGKQIAMKMPCSTQGLVSESKDAGNKLCALLQRGLDVLEACRLHAEMGNICKQRLLSAGGPGVATGGASKPPGPFQPSVVMHKLNRVRFDGAPDVLYCSVCGRYTSLRCSKEFSQPCTRICLQSGQVALKRLQQGRYPSHSSPKFKKCVVIGRPLPVTLAELEATAAGEAAPSPAAAAHSSAPPNLAKVSKSGKYDKKTSTLVPSIASSALLERIRSKNVANTE